MFIGLVQYYVQGKTTLKSVAIAPTNPLSAAEKKTFFRAVVLVLLALAVLFGAAAATGHLTVDFFINFISVLGIFLPIYYFTKMLRSKDVTPDEKKKVLAYIPLFLSAIVFWSLEEQGSSILALFAADRTQSTLFGINIPASLYQTLNPLFVVLLTPVFVWLWTKLGSRQPRTEVKFAIGLVLAGLSFLLLMLPSLLFGV